MYFVFQMGLRPKISENKMTALSALPLSWNQERDPCTTKFTCFQSYKVKNACARGQRRQWPPCPCQIEHFLPYAIFPLLLGVLPPLPSLSAGFPVKRDHGEKRPTTESMAVDAGAQGRLHPFALTKFNFFLYFAIFGLFLRKPCCYFRNFISAYRNRNRFDEKKLQHYYEILSNIRNQESCTLFGLWLQLT